MQKNIETIENGRASYAFAEVQSVIRGGEEKIQKNYQSYIKKLPSMIQVNGLGQTMAFCYAKGEVYRKIYNQIGQWIGRQGHDFEGQEFVEWLINQNSQTYRVVTIEVLALLGWMRRFADGMMKDQKVK